MGHIVSVIIPVYNVAKYLDQCLQSVINQSYNDLEIILIDDGSTDESGKMCDKYADIDSRIRVVHSANGGLSAARNKGLDIATGEWIMFLDSDDVMYPTAVEDMAATILNTSADMVIGTYHRLSCEGMLQNTVRESEASLDFVPISEFDFWELFNSNMKYCVVWTKIYSADIWKDLRFPEGHINEDLYVLGDIVKQCRHIVNTNHSVVGYRVREGSIMHTEGFRKSIDNSYAALDLTIYLFDRFSENILPINAINSMWKRGFNHLRDGIKDGLININDSQVKSLIRRYYSQHRKMFKIASPFRRKCSLLMFSILGRNYFRLWKLFFARRAKTVS